MKQLFLVLFFTCIAGAAGAQGTSFANADTIGAGVVKTFAFSSTQTIHYYRAVLPAEGVVRMVESLTNGLPGSYNAQVTIYQKNQSVWRTRNIFMAGNSSLADTFLAGGIAADTVYFSIYSGGSATFNYSFRWDMLYIAPNNETEPNGTLTQAQPLTPIDTAKGHSGFTTTTLADTFDYYRIILPKAATIKLYVRATNLYADAAAFPAPFVAVRTKSGGGIIMTNRANVQGASLRVSDQYSSQPVGVTWYDTMSVYAQTADTIYVALYNLYYGTPTPVSYRLRYELTDTLTINETEPNNTRAQAQVITSVDTVRGTIRYESNGTLDNDDYFKVVLPADGSLRLYFSVKNTDGLTAALPPPTVTVYDKTGAAILMRNNSFQTGAGMTPRQSVYYPFGAMLADTFSVHGLFADTVYVRVSQGCLYCSNTGAQYRLRWEMYDSTVKNEIEPNNTLAQAQLITRIDTIKATIRYQSIAGLDNIDYYKAIFPVEGSMRIYFSVKNIDGQAAATPPPTVTIYDKLGTVLFMRNNAFLSGYGMPPQASASYPYGSTLADTFLLTGRQADTMYISVSQSCLYCTNSGAQYRLRWELADSTRSNETEPNNTMVQAQNFKVTDTIYGHSGYFAAGAGQSNYDGDDYFRIVKPANGTLRFYVNAANYYNNSGASPAPRVFAYDKAGTPLYVYSQGAGFATYTGMFLRNANINYNATISDTLTITCVASDTVYIRIYNAAYNGPWPSAYNMRYEFLPGPIADFSYSRVGNEFGFLNNSRYQTSNLWIMGNGSTYTSYAPPVINYLPNAYTVKLVADQGSCSYHDTASISFTVAGVEHYTPKSSGRGGDIAFQIFGGGLDSTTLVQFRQGSTILTPTKQYTNGKKNFLTATMDFHSVPTGLYDVVITVPGLAPITYTNGFRVDSFRYPYAWSQVSGPARWLANRPTRFNLVVGNNGNVMASGVVVAMLWPKTANLTWLKEDYKPSFIGTDTFVVPALSKTYTVPRSAYQFIYDSVNMFSPIDSFEGKPYDGYIKFFQIPYIPANSTVSIPFNAITSATAQQRFYTYTHRPNIFGSCPNGNQEDFMNDMSGELIDAVDGFADKTKVPLFQAFTKTAKVGQFHMRSAATYVGDEFWAWYDGYETDHNANEAAWIGRTDEANQAAEQVFAQEVGDALLSHAVGKAKLHNDQIDYYNKLLANNPKLSPKSFDKAIDILNKNGKALGGISYNRLELLKKLYDVTKDMGSQSEKLAKLLELINNCPELKDQQKEILDMLGGELDHNGGSATITQTANSFDPNDIYGPQGVGTPGYLSGTQRQPFLVTFENVDTASADAQTVVVLDTIDKTKFDINSLSLGDAVVGGQLFRVPQGRREFMVQNAMDSIRGIRLRIVATTDTAHGIIRWQFTALDSATNNIPVLKGFLPPNKNGVQGAGSVSYTIKPSVSAIDGSVLKSRASIVFDYNAAIATGTWMNTIDLLPPTSQVVSATHLHDSTILLRFSGSDATSGIQKYKVYYSTNNGAWYQLGDAADDSMLIAGQPDSSYRFYCVAVDRVENREVKAPVAEASVKVPPLGVATSHSSGAAFSVFPNPANGNAYIRLSLKGDEEIDIRLQSLAGGEVARLWSGRQSGNATLPIDISAIPSGVYLIVLSTGSGLHDMAKLVVVH